MSAPPADSLPRASPALAGSRLPDPSLSAHPPPQVQAQVSAGDVSARPRATEASLPSSAHTTHVAESPPESLPAPLAKRLFLDLFAGASSPVSQAIADLGLARLEPVDILVGPSHDLLDDSTFQTLQRLCSSGLVGVAAAAPPCAAFSRARLRQGGPPPVRTVLHPTGILQPSVSQAKELKTSALLHSRTRHLLHLVAGRGGMIWKSVSLHLAPVSLRLAPNIADCLGCETRRLATLFPLCTDCCMMCYGTKKYYVP